MHDRARLQRSTACAFALLVLGGTALPGAARAQGSSGNPAPANTPATASDATTAATAAPAAEAAPPVLGDAPTLIPEVNVQATAWRAWQPTSGYVAPVTTTGSKTDTPIIEAPQSLGVVTRDQIDDQQAQSVSQALRYTAGVLPEVRPSNRYDSVFVRGFGGTGSSAAYVNFLDGLRQQRGISYNVPGVDPWLLERIEVLRGPASVLYGQTGAGGLVNLVSKRPTEEPIHEVRLEAGNYGRVQSLFDFGGKLTEDGEFTYRLTGVARRADTQYDDTTESRIAIAPAVTWRPDNDTTLTILGNFQRDPEGGFYNFVPATGTVIANPRGKLRSSFFGGDPNFDDYERNQASIGYQFERRLDQVWTVRQNFRYSYIDSDFKALSIRTVNASTGAATRLATQSFDVANTFALDNQAQASFDTGPLRHTVLFGLDWARDSAKRKLGSANSTAAFNIFQPLYYQYITPLTIGAAQTTYQNQDQLGLYAQDQVAFGKFRFNIGVRHDWATSETVTRSTSAHTSQDDGKTTWRTGLLYLFDNGLAPYASYSTSFLPNAGTSSPARGNTPFDPTTGEQYEAGVKYQPPGFNSYVQAAAYHIRQDNVLTTDPNNALYSVETGRIRSRGVELEARASLADGLDLIAAYSYIDAEVTRSNGTDLGKRVPQVPHNLASGWLNYRFNEGPLRGLELGGGVRYVGSTYGNTTNTFKVDDVTLFDAAIRYDVGAAIPQAKGLELTLNANNIADKSYVASCSSEVACYYGNRLLLLGGVRLKW
ncbi:TonB-dependent siderophore receptor [Roseomonas elaeocarpi]|uniref:TonB-dependent siderophore receptor n=1 Tax=Roseomonas elaeocarpi TaxID=907779 RepID=A0ABV6JW01_9PROT